ncbi:MAG: serine protease [Myxococcaceae bacterium]|nr:serine protease [Myxococcaceae bacterium]
MAIPGSELSEVFAQVVESTGKSVVRVQGRRRPFSGIVWSAKEVVTVHHALQHVEGELIVGVDGAEWKARLKGSDPSTDLALLEVDGALPPASFDSGGALKVGNLVLRLARPGQTVRATAGIVGAQGKTPWRTHRGGEIDRYLESDAAHQPGFSGGPLVGLDGKVLGMTTTGLLRGTSLTLPTPTLQRVISQLQQYGKVRQSYLGLSMQPLALPDDVKQLTGEEVGLVVIAVEKGGPADAAGLTYGDIVLHLGDATVKTVEDLFAYLRSDHVGQQVPVKFFRQGKVQTIQVTLGAKP